jgi:5-methylthioadenosine/S-adenosylhomocysteine deaminase
MKNARQARGRKSTKLPARGEFVVRNACVMTMDSELGDLPCGDVHVRDGEVIAVGTKLAARGAANIDARGMIALPGLVDTHWHMWSTQLRGLSGDAAEGGYFLTKTAFGKVYQPEDMYRGVRLAAAEALHSGITTVHDWCHNIRGPEYADADLRALAESGIRARFSYGYSEDLPLDQSMDFADLPRVQREWFVPAGDGLLTLGAALRGVICAPEVYRQEWKTARALGLPISVHADASRKRLPWHQIETMFAEGMLGKDVQVVHANNATRTAIDILAETGTSASLSPLTEMRIGFGYPPTAALLAAGVRVSLSVDAVMLSGNADMFAIMKAVQNVETARAEDEFAFPARRALELATIAGAAALGIADRVGSLAPGKRADMILVSTGDANTAPMTDPASLLVEAAEPANVDTVIVDGRILKRRGKLTTLDVEEAVREANESLKELRERVRF